MIYPRSTINNEFGNNAFEWMVESARENDIRLEIYFIEDIIIEYGGDTGDFCVLIGGEYRQKPAFVFMRCYDKHAGVYFEEKGIKVFNRTNAMFISQDKHLTGLMLSGAGCKIPKTVISCVPDYGEISKKLGKKFIVKDNYGMKGEGVYLIGSGEELEALFKSGEGMMTPLYQEFIEYSFGTDLRVYTLGDRVLGCVRRIAYSGFKSNLSQGGRVEEYELTEEIRRIAVMAAKTLGLEFAGVDLLFDKDGFTVCEVNGNAGFRTISAISKDVDVCRELFEYIRKQID